MLRLTSRHTCSYATRLLSSRDWSQHAAQPSKAMLQTALPYTSNVFLHPAERAHQTAAPRRHLSTFDYPGPPGLTRKPDRDGRNSKPSAASSRHRVAVDVDEVLGRFLYSLNLFCFEQYGMKYDVQDYWVYEYAKIWNCSQERSNEIVYEFFKSRHFLDGIPTIPGAFDALSRISNSCDLVVVTSRQHVIQDITLEWLDRHYPGLFQEVYFGNHWALEGVSRKKSDICRSIGAGVLIDDNPGYALDCAQAGLQVLLYDWDHSYPWSKIPQEKMHPLITVVRDWDEVERAVQMLQPRQVSSESGAGSGLLEH